MESQLHPCDVCGKPTTAFNYGAYCCNACKMFYRRSSVSRNFPTKCKNPGNCLDCRFCRFQRCLQAGIRHEIVQFPRQNGATLDSVITSLTNKDNHRKRQFLNFIPCGDLSIDDLVLTDDTGMAKKPKGHQMSVHGWITMNHTTAVNSLKKFQFFDGFSNSEKIKFVKQSHVPLGMLNVAMRSYSNQLQVNEYPGGLDIFSDELKNFYQNSPAILNNCRSQVLRKLWELRMSNEEFLLLSAIIACNPVSSNFDAPTRAILSQHQNEYALHFTKLCQHLYQKNWPGRFMEILSVCNTIGKAYEDLKKMIVPFQLSRPRFPRAKILEDSLKTIMK